MLINSIPSEIQILVLTIILFIINLLWNWLIYKTKGPSRCPATSTLINREYDLTYGMITATPFILLAVIVCIVYSQFGVQSISFTKTAYYTVGFYVLLSIALNLWGQRFLRKRGINPKPEDWKGFWKTYMENVKKYKERHSSLKQWEEPDSLDVFIHCGRFDEQLYSCVVARLKNEAQKNKLAVVGTDELVRIIPVSKMHVRLCREHSLSIALIDCRESVEKLSRMCRERNRRVWDEAGEGRKKITN